MCPGTCCCKPSTRSPTLKYTKNGKFTNQKIGVYPNKKIAFCQQKKLGFYPTKKRHVQTCERWKLQQKNGPPSSPRNPKMRVQRLGLLHSPWRFFSVQVLVSEMEIHHFFIDKTNGKSTIFWDTPITLNSPGESKNLVFCQNVPKNEKDDEIH